MSNVIPRRPRMTFEQRVIAIGMQETLLGISNATNRQ